MKNKITKQKEIKVETNLNSLNMDMVESLYTKIADFLVMAVLDNTSLDSSVQVATLKTNNNYEAKKDKDTSNCSNECYRQENKFTHTQSSK